MKAREWVVAAAVAAAACGGSPTGPDDSAVQVLRGQAIGALDARPAPGVTVQIGRERPVTTDGNGLFDVDVASSSSHAVVLSGAGVVERRTTVAASAGERVRVSLIPASFDLDAFDQMFRTSGSHLQRWTTAPKLVVVASVMEYGTAFAGDYPATGELLSDNEVSTMIAHLTEGLSLLTGGAFASFGSIDVERPGGGARVAAMRPNTIVVGRYNGVVTFAQTIGFGQWAAQSDGRVTSGAMFLDRDFDRNDPRRRLLRIHELGHALGYQHVTSRASIMNPSIGPEPTEFDRVAPVVAFQRPPGNRAPDTDPDSVPRSVFSVTVHRSP
jgi:hypothetical protein